MIKAISYLRPTANTAAYERLSGFLAALGFAQGKGWTDGPSTAASFSAPLAKIELIDGVMQYPSEIFVEVTSVDTSSPTFTATFNKPHSSGFGIFVPKFGNPGPQSNFSARDNSAVVLYAAVVD